MTDDIRAELDKTKALIDDLRKKIEAQEAKQASNWPERVEVGDFFRCGTETYLGRDILTIRTDAHETTWKELVENIMKAMTAPEPTGAELVGKVCEFSLDGNNWAGKLQCTAYEISSGLPYKTNKTLMLYGSHMMRFRFARLAR